MTSRPEPSSPPAAATLSPPAAILAAFLAIGLLADVGAAIALPSSAGFRGVRLAHFALAASQLLGCGALLAAATSAWRRADARRPIPALPFMLAGAIAVGVLVLPEDLEGFGERLAGEHAAAATLALSALTAAALAVVVALVRRSTRRSVRLASAAAGVILGLENALQLQHDYRGPHLLIALLAGALLAHGLAGMKLPPAVARAASSARIGAAIGVLSAASIVAPLPNAVAADMWHATGAVILPYAARLHAPAARKANLPPEKQPWFSPRADLPATPARGPRILPPDAIVVLLTVDALRADVIMSGKYDAILPNFAALKADGVRFTQARSSASQTVPSVTGLFTGKYFTQLYWSGGTAKHAWPHDDPSVGFPALLGELGVHTVSMPTLHELLRDHAVARGFAEEKIVTPPLAGEHTPIASVVARRVRARLGRAAHDERALFLYAHFVDPHAPYTRGGTDCEPFDCYLREVALVDQAIGEIRASLRRPALAKRALLIVSADHGEGFDEHGYLYHATTLYDELLRVPLIVSGAPFTPRDVNVPVSLLDLGPTLLELFGAPAPPAFMGQSLVRLLQGQPDHLTRPIAADSGRHMQALVFDDNVKIIVNNRANTVEMYNLNVDPGEKRNIFDTALDAEERLAEIQALFAANAYRKAGYSAPYRK